MHSIGNHHKEFMPKFPPSSERWRDSGKTSSPDHQNDCTRESQCQRRTLPLKNIVSGSFNEIVQIDHQKICQAKSGYTRILVMIDHSREFVEVSPCRENTAE